MPTTLAETLRTTREGKRIKLTQVAERTRIPLDRLQALESDKYTTLPDDVYLRGAIRNYAIFLGLDPNDTLALYRAVRPTEEKAAPLSTITTARRVAVIPVAITVLVILILILVVAHFALGVF